MAILPFCSLASATPLTLMVLAKLSLECTRALSEQPSLSPSWWWYCPYDSSSSGLDQIFPPSLLTENVSMPFYSQNKTHQLVWDSKIWLTILIHESFFCGQNLLLWPSILTFHFWWSASQLQSLTQELRSCRHLPSLLADHVPRTLEPYSPCRFTRIGS